MNDETINTEFWGKYAPRGRERSLLLVKQLGLSHGAIKKLIAQAWLKRHPHTPVDITSRHIKYRLHPWDNVTDARILFGSGQRDRTELETLRDYVSDGGTFVDIGANIGHYSLVAAQYGASRILAIEPNPHVFNRLMFHITTNGFENCIHAEQVALGDHEGDASLYIPEAGDVGGSRINDRIAKSQQIIVPMRPLTDVLQSHSIERIDALKIDIEGMEDSVLFPFYESAEQSLWPRLVVIEHTSATDWGRDIISWMRENGYSTLKQTRSNMMLELNSQA